MKHIVVDARILRTSTGRYVERLLHYLQRIDDIHRYSVLLKPQDIDSWQPANPNFTAIASPYKEFSFDEQLALRRQIEALKPDLVHFTMVQQPVLYGGLVVTTMHDLTTIRYRNPAKNPVTFTAKQQVYKLLNRRVARKSAAIIVPTEFVKTDVAAFTGIDQHKITVTYEAADDLPAPAKPVTGLNQDLNNVPFIMYVGRPTPHKNLERLIEAFTRLQPDHPELCLVLAGKQDANYLRIQEQVRRQGTANVIFTGFIDDQQLRWLYEHCRAYVFPSLSEGFGLPGLEAMRHAAPVISSNASCLPEVYGDAALYFDPLDIADMATTIGAVLNDVQRRQDLITKGYVQASTYSWQRMAEQTLEVYRRVLGN